MRAVPVLRASVHRVIPNTTIDHGPPGADTYIGAPVVCQRHLARQSAAVPTTVRGRVGAALGQSGSRLRHRVGFRPRCHGLVRHDEKCFIIRLRARGRRRRCRSWPCGRCAD
jgi:hypothetical protein